MSRIDYIEQKLRSQKNYGDIRAELGIQSQAWDIAIWRAQFTDASIFQSSTPTFLTGRQRLLPGSRYQMIPTSPENII